jgi:AcrR family transcriptional regulator
MNIDRSAPQPAIDRRVARTRALIQDALIALVGERGLDAITVEDICRRANVGRSTFYAHYRDKTDLQQATLDAHLRSLGAAGADDGPARAFGFSLPFFTHVQAFRSMHPAPHPDLDHTVHDMARRRVEQDAKKEIAGRFRDTGAPEPLLTAFVTATFMAVLTWWLKNPDDLPPETVDDLFQQLVARGLAPTAADPVPA